MPDATVESPRPGAAPSGKRLRVLSGMQPTGRMHLGNYLGALRNWGQIQDDYDCVFVVADYHSLTEVTEPASIRPAIVEMVLDWLAAGIDPGRSTVFLQSDLPEVPELHLLLSMSTPLGWLERVPTYKEKVAQFPDNQNYGLLGYPVLQAADILLPPAHPGPGGAGPAPPTPCHGPPPPPPPPPPGPRGRRGPGPPHRADPGDRAPLQPPFRPGLSRTPGPVHRDPASDGHRRAHQDEQEPGQHHRHAGQPRADPQVGDDHGHRRGAAAPRRPGPPRALQRL